MKPIAMRLANFDSSEIRKVFVLAQEINSPLDLSIGQPDFDVPQEVKEAAIKSIKTDNNCYTPTAGLASLRKAIAQKLLKKNNIKVSPDEVIVTAGTTGAIFLGFMALLDSDDEVIILDPYFIAYKEIANLIGAKPKIVATSANFQPNIKAIRKSITKKTKLIVLNSPNNPTGAVYPKESIKQIVELAKQNDLFILSDEVYEDYVYEGEHFSPGSIYKNTITLNGFSKSCAATGWRIGYAVGPKEIIDQMAKLQQFIFVCAPSFAQEAAIKALDFDNGEIIAGYKKKRDIIYDGLRNKFEIVKPCGAFYAFLKTPYEEEKFVKDLLKRKVVVVPGKTFSQKENYIRISFANKDDILKQAIKIINQI